ncbi:hypothetical protein M404DRAFT_991319 [Pisolithus tinctorius Marx 270]|uniref:F-box domain-containing protein n=1 Tax=Pisolithus tinctorius Marx 270 TaxID=870435 RepID=A0A0C3JZG9_PISTI|nr:hypothetical protein M404DRAFT_991319 [Pisolithus tinctorius Marx 270]
MMFPSLKRVAILTTRSFNSPSFLDLQHIHMLEHLDLGEGIRLDNFSAAASLKSLRLECFVLLAPLLPSIASLRTLTISGSGRGALRPGSIHFPLLESLTVALDCPESFLAAIVTPRLGYFSWSSRRSSDYWSEIFVDLKGKFPSVQHLCLQYSCRYAEIEDTVVVYAAFPGVRHIEMKVSDFLAFCVAEVDDSPLSIADRWTHLEHLTLVQLGYEDSIDSFIEWLRARKLRGQPPLQLTLSKFNPDYMLYAREVLTIPWLISLHKSLHEYCLLEWKDVPVTFNLTVPQSDSDVDGNLPIIGMVESAISTQIVYASTGTDG